MKPGRVQVKGFNAKSDISILSGEAAQTVAFMPFCVETPTFNEILTAIYLILTDEILPAGAGQGEEDFSAEKRTCVNLAFIALCIGATQVVMRALNGCTSGAVVVQSSCKRTTRVQTPRPSTEALGLL